MSRWLISIYLCLLAVSLQAAQSIKFDSLHVGSQTFSNVTVVGMNATEVFFTHDKGMSNVKMKYLDPDVQKRLDFDPKAAAAAENELIQQDARFKNSLATKTPGPVKKPDASEKVHVSSEDNFADPVSDASVLGKAAPRIEIVKWLGEKPDLKDKFVLLDFWAPWSFPAKKAIAQLSNLQKKFAQKLVVVAVASESQDDVEAMTDPKIDFASAIDDKGKLRAAFHVATVPTVVLIDPKGVVLYEGHPAALNEKQLQNILSKSE
jgi:cytochrome c biogenesis protein CcmG/thiol:disulfide interchange protein DsbE